MENQKSYISQSRFILKCINILSKSNVQTLRVRKTQSKKDQYIRIEVDKFYNISKQDISNIFSISKDILKINLTSKALIILYKSQSKTSLVREINYTPIISKITNLSKSKVGNYVKLEVNDKLTLNFIFKGDVKILSLSQTNIRIQKEDGGICGMSIQCFNKLI